MSSANISGDNKTITFVDSTKADTLTNSFVSTNLTPSIVNVIIDGYSIIDNNAFYNITRIKLITFRNSENLKTIGNNAFSGTSIESIIIPASVETIEDGTFNTISLTEVTFEKDSKLKTIKNQAFRGTSIKSIIIPASVETIESYAFMDLTTLTEIKFEDNSKLKTIKNQAFMGTSIKSIIIPASVETIGFYAFNQASLKTVYISDTIKLLDGTTISIGNNKEFFGALNVNILKIGTTSKPLSISAIIAIIFSIIAALGIGIGVYIYIYKK
jgi:hypothetical protein